MNNASFNLLNSGNQLTVCESDQLDLAWMFVRGTGSQVNYRRLDKHEDDSDWMMESECGMHIMDITDPNLGQVICDIIREAYKVPSHKRALATMPNFHGCKPPAIMDITQEVARVMTRGEMIACLAMDDSNGTFTDADSMREGLDRLTKIEAYELLTKAINEARD